MTLRIIFVGVVLSLSINLVSAADKVKSSQASKSKVAKIWTQEPDSFLGVNLVNPTIPDCPTQSGPYATGIDWSRVQREKIICINGKFGEGSSDYYLLRGEPDLGFGYELSASIPRDRSKINSFLLQFDSDDYKEIANLFIKKYGEPTEKLSLPVRTKAGIGFIKEVLVWNGKKISIRLANYGDSISKGYVSLADKEYEEKTRKAAEERSESATSKL